MAINRDGFLKIAPNDKEVYGLALYRFHGEIWQQYTVGGFVFYEDEPAALLYFETRFLDTEVSIPQFRTWSFNMSSNTPFPIQIPALQLFPVEEGWEANVLRAGDDGLMYYRVARRSGRFPSVRMFRTPDLSQRGEEISAEVFFNSVPRTANISHILLPSLPEGFVYTGIGQVGGSLFASWEEQEDFNIGAAGFVVIKNP
jgi:hypothetical protein